MGKSDSASANAPDKEKEASNKNVSNADGKDEQPKEDVENLRKVIKLNDNENEGKKSEQPAESTKDEKNEEDDLDGINDLVEEAEEQGTAAPASTREELEQKRAILQRIKDFDFQIKKNQQDINAVGEKITALSKDLDDLVSLYEIVSEQMNPFVGLSKVTKKRLESLENITREVDMLKEKLSTIEAGGSIQTLKQEQRSNMEPSFEVDLSDQEMERIIELSFSELAPELNVENTIDDAIDVFIENLKAGKIN
jgi:archaeal flagellar protein FlaC